jgi:hypothetical protein
LDRIYQPPADLQDIMDFFVFLPSLMEGRKFNPA